MSRLPASVSFGASLLLAGTFFLSRCCLKFTRHIERRWHALSAGVAVAYVFVSIMPELEEHRPVVAGSAIGTLLDTEKRIYIWALAGFMAFTGLSRLRSAPSDSPRKVGQLYSGTIAGYALYVLLMGYLLVRREDSSVVSLGLYVFAIGLHLFIMDGELAEQFEHRLPTRRKSVAGLLCALWVGVGDCRGVSGLSRLPPVCISRRRGPDHQRPRGGAGRRKYAVLVVRWRSGRIRHGPDARLTTVELCAK